MRHLTVPSLIIVVTWLLFSGLCYADDNFRIGDSEQEIMAAMGEPTGRAVSENVVILEYPLILIKLKDNKVVDSWDNEVKETRAITVEAKPVNPEEVPVVNKKIPLPKPSKKITKKYKKIKSINNNGEQVDLNSLLVPGKVTIRSEEQHV